MINQYGADAVRWFILSDSPPEKDVQWSDIGVVSANKFLQKIWNLNYLISSKTESSSDKTLEKKFSTSVENFIVKIDSSINNFRFNVAVANFYEIYNFFKKSLDKKISKQVMKDNIIRIMKVMIPFVPHIAHECLELHKCDTENIWPKVNKENILDEVNIAIQINGKTRDIIKIKKDLSEEEIKKIILKNSKAKKYIAKKTIKKTIFVKNKIINYIIHNS